MAVLCVCKDARKPSRIELSCTELEICGGHQMSKAIIQVHRTTASKRMCHALSKRKDSHKRIREAVACVCERNRAHPPPCAATHTPKRQTRSRTCANVGGGGVFFLSARACVPCTRISHLLRLFSADGGSSSSSAASAAKLQGWGTFLWCR